MSDEPGRDDNILDISAEDLDVEPEPVAPTAPVPAEDADALPPPPLPGGEPTQPLPSVPGGASHGTVDIDLDLSDPDVEPLAAPTKPMYAPPTTPLSGPVTALPGDFAKGKKQTMGEAVVTATLNILPLAVAGGLGGMLAWGLTEPFTKDVHMQTTLVDTMRSMALFGGTVGACVAALIGAVDGITASDVRRAARGAGLGLGIGLVGGALGGVLAQVVYGAMHGGQEGGSIVWQILARSIGWAMVGVFIGLAPGLIARAKGKLTNGIVGGLIGGAIGGFLFDPVAFVVGGGSVSRMIALGALGVASGMAIAVVEQVRKEAWLVITAGPLTGKQFILYNETTNIGRSPAADIPLMKEMGAAEQHCRIVGGHADYTLEDLSGGATLVNGRVASRQRLGGGDVIQIGQTALTFYEKAAGKA